MFTLESPHRGDSNEYTQYTIFDMNKKNTLNYPKSAAMGFFSKGLKNEFKIAVVNEPSVLEPLKFYCTYVSTLILRNILTHILHRFPLHHVYPLLPLVASLYPLLLVGSSIYGCGYIL